MRTDKKRLSRFDLSLKTRWLYEAYRSKKRAKFAAIPNSIATIQSRAKKNPRHVKKIRSLSLLLRLLSRRSAHKIHRQYRNCARLYRYGKQRAARLKARQLSKFRRVVRQFRIANDEVALIRFGAQSLVGQRTTCSSVDTLCTVYLVYNSLPYHSAGYAIRSHGLVSGMRALGYDTTIVSRLGYPVVFEKFRNLDLTASEHIDDVPYRRQCAKVDALFHQSNSQYIAMNVVSTCAIVSDLSPAIIHGASNFVTGLSAVGVARRLGVPSVYEVRGLWEITEASRDPSYYGSLRFAHAVRLETEACIEADAVIAITNALKDELIRRGVSGDKITVIPNGVDTKRFRPITRDWELANRLGFTSEHIVIGYVGSILDYEGLDDLLRAAQLCKVRGFTNIRILIVGDGAYLPTVRDLAAGLQLRDEVVFTGRVSHDEVNSYYSLIDVTPFPRKPLPVCEMVSPLKPFEAMAMGKCVIVSSVAALAEIVGDRPVGLVHEKGSYESLAEVLSQVLIDPELRNALGNAAREFVVAERDWSVLAERVAQVYRTLGVQQPANEMKRMQVQRSNECQS